ncbi:hypothetical protein ACIQ9J_34045 [Streptomyces sp. NPDC094153]|uniref:hypothetical protein n=1 Tax=Streptomyces sp. NPDC094153 TaxID=3366058 RepID=UPI00380FF447
MDSTEPAERERPPALAPADEAMLARAQTLREITDAALRDVAQLYPADDPGSVLRDALFIQGLAERLVDQAVVVERERGASWTDIGSAASSSRQAAHERWNTTVGAWVLMERRRTGIGNGPADPATHAQYLDEWYADLVGERQAVSALLPSLHDEAARTEANSRRAEAKQLHERAEELRKEIDAAYTAAMEATGTDAAEEKRAVWAAKHLASAEVYKRLAAIEEPIAVEHRRRATAQRKVAQDIVRDHAQQTLPADDGTRERVYAAYHDLTPQERSGSTHAVTTLLAERLNGPTPDSIRRHLAPVIEAYRQKERIGACSDPHTAVTTAFTLIRDHSRVSSDTGTYWYSQSRTLLSGYLMAAALSDGDLDTVHAWVSRPDDRRPVELLRTGPVPQWADECEQILNSPHKIRVNVLLIIQSVLREIQPRSTTQKEGSK